MKMSTESWLQKEKLQPNVKLQKEKQLNVKQLQKEKQLNVKDDNPVYKLTIRHLDDELFSFSKF